MIDLVKVMASEHFFHVVEYLHENPESNASTVARALNIHIVTVQKILDTLDKYGIVDTSERRGIGRPSKIYTFRGGKILLDLDRMLQEYGMRHKRVRDKGTEDISYNYDLDREIVNAVVIGGKKGNKIRLDERDGRFVWMVPPPDSDGETIEKLAAQAGLPVVDAIRLTVELEGLDVLEVLG